MPTTYFGRSAKEMDVWFQHRYVTLMRIGLLGGIICQRILIYPLRFLTSSDLGYGIAMVSGRIPQLFHFKTMTFMAFNGLEKKALSGLALLYASRMLGLFMVFPILSLYGQDLHGATSATLGLALGIYGLTQAFLQIPFGAVSDRFGRKPLIFMGLVIFFIGSVIAAMADSVTGLVIGRALQGSGAISSVILAMLADYTREEERSKSMAVIGVVIGASFVVAVMLGPWVAHLGGLSGVFWLTSCLALLGLVVLLMLPPVPAVVGPSDRRVRRDLLHTVFKDTNVLVLSLSVGLLHLTMTALFVALPLVLVSRGVSADHLGYVYAPVMIIAFLGMVPMIIASEKNSAHVKYLRLAGTLIAFALVGISLNQGALLTALMLLVFFVGFNFIEATLPSLLSRKVEASRRGTAMGVFSTFQFVGAACGGVLGGVLFAHQNLFSVVVLGLIAQLIWVGALAVITPIEKRVQGVS